MCGGVDQSSEGPQAGGTRGSPGRGRSRLFLGVQALKGIGEFAVEGQTDVNIQALIASIPEDWRDEFLVTSDEVEPNAAGEDMDIVAFGPEVPPEGEES